VEWGHGHTRALSDDNRLSKAVLRDELYAREVVVFEWEALSTESQRGCDGRCGANLCVCEWVFGEREFVAFEEFGNFRGQGRVLDGCLARDRLFDPIDHVITRRLLERRFQRDPPDIGGRDGVNVVKESEQRRARLDRLLEGIKFLVKVSRYLKEIELFNACPLVGHTNNEANARVTSA